MTMPHDLPLRDGTGTPPRATHRSLRILATVLTVVAMLLTAAAGWFAATASRTAHLGQIEQAQLSLARSLVNQADADDPDDPAAFLDRLHRLWTRTDETIRGHSLCAIAADGRLLFHAARGDLVGRDVGGVSLPDDDGGPRTVRELIEARGEWVGRNRSHAGRDQYVAYTYSRTLDGLVAVHQPAETVDSMLLAATIPWMAGFGVLGLVVVPGSLLLMSRANAVLQRQQQRVGRELSEVTRHARSVVWESEGPPEWPTTRVSPSTAAMLGHDVQSWLDDPGFWEGHVHPDDRAAAVAGIHAAVENRADTVLEYRFRCGDGSWLWIRDAITVDIDAADRPVRLRGVMTDITDRRRSELSVRATEQRYERVVEDLPDLVCRFRPDTTITFVNRAYAAYFGRTTSDLTGSSFLELVPPDDHERLLAHLADLGPEVPTRTIEHRAVSADGSIRWHQWRDRALFDADATLVEFQSIGRDITERRRTETALRESEARFRQLAESIDEVFWLIEWPSRRTVYLSPAFDRIWGRPGAERLGGLDRWSDTVHPEDGPRVTRAFARAAEIGTFDLEYRIIAADGSIRWIHERAFPIRNEDGVVFRIAGIANDITARRTADAELTTKRRTEELLRRELNHRVRNNLASLTGLIDLARRTATDVDTFADTIAGRVHAMATAHRFLTESHWQSVDLRDLIHAITPPETVGRLACTGLDCLVPPDRASPLAMVLHELSTNSLKYGALGHGGGRVQLTWEVETLTDGSRLELRWQENGGPRISSEPEPGVGLSLISGLMRADLEGRAAFGFPARGADHTLIALLPAETHLDAAEETTGMPAH